jgi:hypothetical protein
MRARAMDSMSLKIHSFLRNVGVDAAPNSNVSELVAYFEREYGLRMMGFLESEWLNEQLERDFTTGSFADLRAYVSERQMDDFNEDLAELNS